MIGRGELFHKLTEAVARWRAPRPSGTPPPVSVESEISEQFRGPHEGDDIRPWYRVDVRTAEELVVALEVQPPNVRATYVQVNPNGTKTPILESI